MDSWREESNNGSEKWKEKSKGWKGNEIEVEQRKQPTKKTALVKLHSVEKSLCCRILTTPGTFRIQVYLQTVNPLQTDKK